jgi:sigma-B regulation protein RsbU (phosphoserine phosphatase)
LLPDTPPEIEGFNFAWKYQPCADLAGDFLNVFRLDERRLGFYVLDVVGHGAAAALQSVTLSRWLTPTSNQSLLLSPRFEGSSEYRITPPAEVAALLNDLLFKESPKPQYFTMIYGVLDIDTKELLYVSAGHPGPLHQPHRGESKLLESTSVPIGILEGAKYYESALRLQPGDRLFLFTDGLTESANPDGQEFGDEMLNRKLNIYENLEIAKVVRRLMKDVEEWRGNRPMRDDTSILGIEVELTVDLADQSLLKAKLERSLARSGI